MKKGISIILSIVLVLSMSASAFASEAPLNDNTIYVDTITPREARFSIDDIQEAAFSGEEYFSLYTSHYFPFDDTPYNSMTSDFIEYEVQQGEEVRIEVISCSWYPHTCNLEIGILNLDNGYDYSGSVGGGNYTGTLIFGDMDAARYMVFVRNTSAATITDGSIRYSITSGQP